MCVYVCGEDRGGLSLSLPLSLSYRPQMPHVEASFGGPF